mmetsp:Transcript_36911/g.56520  ORF Transcript_36911/g.56520 Transcript_36911/m.56520 type:complete len:172 (-) Transcript_36911:54-569(-)
MTEAEAERMKAGLKGDDDDQVKQIGTTDPIGDFKKMVTDRKQDKVNDALRQMSNIIINFIQGSLQGDLFEKAFDCLRAMRESCVKEDEAGKFNDFLEMLRARFSARGKLDFFMAQIVKNKMTLITSDESEYSSVITAKEAEAFLKWKPDSKAKEEAPKKPKQDDDDLDLID